MTFEERLGLTVEFTSSMHAPTSDACVRSRKKKNRPNIRGGHALPGRLSFRYLFPRIEPCGSKHRGVPRPVAGSRGIGITPDASSYYCENPVSRQVPFSNIFRTFSRRSSAADVSLTSTIRGGVPPSTSMTPRPNLTVDCLGRTVERNF